LRIPLAGIDYVATAAYKWLLSPRGAAFLYVDPARQSELHPLQPSWKTPADPHAAYYGPPFEQAAAASRLDGSLAWPVWPGTARALELIRSIGIEAIERRDLELSRLFREGLREIGLRPLFGDDESSQVVGLEVPDASNLERALEREQIVAAVRGKYLRVSFHFYNDESDVERCLRALSSS
jgi:selenocysteine lyase/cysteine desulfurase